MHTNLYLTYKNEEVELLSSNTNDNDPENITNNDNNASEEEETEGEEENDEEAVPHPIYRQGRKVFQDSWYKVYVKAVGHQRQTRYSLGDHLFLVWVETKKNMRPPLLFDLENALQKALVHILDHLKNAYNSSNNQNQVYVTILHQQILRGINSGNYSLNTPSIKIVRWVLSMFYHFLKSNQTLRLNDSFKIQIKVLSRRHTNDLVQRRPGFIRHIYH